MRSTGKLHYRLAHRQRRRTDKISANSEHAVSRLGIHAPLQAEGFTDDSFQPVSPYRTLDVAVDTDAHPLGAIFAGAMNKGEAFSMQASSITINPIKLPSFAQMGVFREAKFTQ